MFIWFNLHKIKPILSLFAFNELELYSTFYLEFHFILFSVLNHYLKFTIRYRVEINLLFLQKYLGNIPYTNNLSF